jgi:hypothetical protein
VFARTPAARREEDQAGVGAVVAAAVAVVVARSTETLKGRAARVQSPIHGQAHAVLAGGANNSYSSVRRYSLTRLI